MFVLATHLPDLRNTPVKDASYPVRVLSLLDPWAQPLWAQVASRYGEGWFFPLVKDGDLVGMAEVWEMSGCIEVRELDLATPDLLPEAIEALKRMLSFYALRGVDVVRATRSQGQDGAEAEDLSPWKRAGFVRFSDSIAFAPIVPQDFEAPDLLAYTLHKQGLATESRFADPIAAANSLGGLRSDLAAPLRAKDFRPLERLPRNGPLSKALAIPAYGQ